MRIYWYLLSFILLTTACLNRNNFSSDLAENDVVQQGFQLTTQPLPFDTTYTKAVAKLYRGNSFVASGAFISERGLFITTYDPVLNVVAGDPAQKSLLTGFSAENLESRILRGSGRTHNTGGTLCHDNFSKKTKIMKTDQNQAF